MSSAISLVYGELSGTMTRVSPIRATQRTPCPNSRCPGRGVPRLVVPLSRPPLFNQYVVLRDPSSALSPARCCSYACVLATLGQLRLPTSAAHQSWSSGLRSTFVMPVDRRILCSSLPRLVDDILVRAVPQQNRRPSEFVAFALVYGAAVMYVLACAGGKHVEVSQEKQQQGTSMPARAACGSRERLDTTAISGGDRDSDRDSDRECHRSSGSSSRLTSPDASASTRNVDVAGEEAMLPEPVRKLPQRGLFAQFASSHPVRRRNQTGQERRRELKKRRLKK